ncbi:MAG TPA: hypothetical protein VHF27_00425 [Acidimicrobiales bacterium]|nr:hypothetical protein [Acidimicrobiales bacterium]
MGSETPGVLPDQVPEPSWEVRRRRYGEHRWLVRHNEVYEIDDITDAVWLGCGEGLTIGVIAQRVAADHGFSLPEAMGMTARAVRALAHLGLVRLNQVQD